MTFKPSEVVLRDIPFVGTFEKAEIECAAALLVHTLASKEDEWRAVDLEELMRVMETRLRDKTQPWHALLTNPFLAPDFTGLVTAGFAERRGETLSFTATGLERMKRWVHKAPAATSEK